MEISADWTDRDQRERQRRFSELLLLSFSFSLLSIWLIAFDESSCSFLFYVHFSQDTVNIKKMIAGHWSPFSQRNKSISIDLRSWLWSMALASGLLLQRVSEIILIRHRVTLITESTLPPSHLMTKWRQLIISRSELIFLNTQQQDQYFSVSRQAVLHCQ